jgi:hypothetical protein
MADNTLSCQRETLHSQQLRSIKKSIDSDHGIYRDDAYLAAIAHRRFWYFAAEVGWRVMSGAGES